MSTSISSKELRDGTAQKRFRDKSSSKYLDEKHVAHFHGLKTAAFLYNTFKPVISVSDLKRLCNDNMNFRLVKIETNKSIHTKIDNKMLKQFAEVMLAKFLHDPKYKKLLMSNPCKLEQLMREREDESTLLRLTGNEAQIIEATTKRVQTIGFPHEYIAFARLYYRCFRYYKKGKYSNTRHATMVWDDKRNSKEFKIYLKKQLNKDTTKTEVSLHRKPTEQRQHYRGAKGGIYYMSKSGKKVYVKNKEAVAAHDDRDDEKYEDGQKYDKNKAKQYYKGPKGGVYYLAESGMKVYVAADSKTAVASSGGDGNKQGKVLSKSSPSRSIGTDGKGKKLYRGSRGGIYYLTPSGNKAYVKKRDE